MGSEKGAAGLYGLKTIHILADNLRLENLQESLSDCLSVCVSVCLSVWLVTPDFVVSVLLPASVKRFSASQMLFLFFF